MVTLALNDAQRLQDMGQFLTFLYQGPATATMTICVLLYVLGPAILAGLAVLAVLIPFQRYFAKRIGRVRSMRPPMSMRV